MKYLKLPLLYQVKFAPISGETMTLEGPVRHEAGDAVMTGSAGEQWPIPRATFDATYMPVPPQRAGEDGRYVKKPLLVDARQTDRTEVVALGDGSSQIRAQPGDWIVTGPDGRQWVVAEAIFRATYQAADEPFSGASQSLGKLYTKA